MTKIRKISTIEQAQEVFKSAHQLHGYARPLRKLKVLSISELSLSYPILLSTY